MRLGIKIVLVPKPKAMKISLRIFMLLMASIVLNACQPEEFSGCPLSYSVKAGNYNLVNSWAFIGFRSKGSGNIDYPPCDTYRNGPTTLGRVRLDFSENPSSIENGFFEFSGVSVINGFGGSYRNLGEGRLEALNQMFTTFIAGNEVLSHYENRYLHALRNMESYKIQNNMLTIAFDGAQEEMIFVLIES